MQALALPATLAPSALVARTLKKRYIV